MFASHKVATAVGSLGVLLVLGHVLLGPDVVPVAVALPGAVAAAAAVGLYLAAVRRRDRDRPAGSSDDRRQ